MLRLILTALVIAGCGGDDEADDGPFTLPEECETGDRYNPCARAAFEELAEQTGGGSEDGNNASELPDRVLAAIERAGLSKPGPLDLFLLIDGTGSMKAELEALQVNGQQLVDAATEHGGEGSRVGIGIYRDKCVDHEWLRFTPLNEPAFAAAALQGAQVMGGGDIPESIYEAIVKTADDAVWENPNRAIVLVGDSHPHDGTECSEYTLKEAADRAIELGIAVHAIIVPLFDTDGG